MSDILASKGPPSHTPSPAAAGPGSGAFGAPPPLQSGGRGAEGEATRAAALALWAQPPGAAHPVPSTGHGSGELLRKPSRTSGGGGGNGGKGNTSSVSDTGKDGPRRSAANQFRRVALATAAATRLVTGNAGLHSAESHARVLKRIGLAFRNTDVVAAANRSSHQHHHS